MLKRIYITHLYIHVHVNHTLTCIYLYTHTRAHTHTHTHAHMLAHSLAKGEAVVRSDESKANGQSSEQMLPTTSTVKPHSSEGMNQALLKTPPKRSTGYCITHSHKYTCIESSLSFYTCSSQTHRKGWT